MNYLFFLFIILAIGIAIYIHLGKKLANMNEGTWEIKLKTLLPDSQTETIVNFTQELSRKDPVPDIPLPDYLCRLRRAKGYLFHAIGNFVLWQVRCEGTNEIQGDGKIKYNRDTFNGKLKMRKIDHDGTHRQFNIYLSGIRTDK
jgi:hypothetical protein